MLPILKELLPSQVTIIDSGEAVARQTKAILEQTKTICTEATHPATHHIYSNDVTHVLEDIIVRFRESGQIPLKTDIQVAYKDF